MFMKHQYFSIMTSKSRVSSILSEVRKQLGEKVLRNQIRHHIELNALLRRI